MYVDAFVITTLLLLLLLPFDKDGCLQPSDLRCATGETYSNSSITAQCARWACYVRNANFVSGATGLTTEQSFAGRHLVCSCRCSMSVCCVTFDVTG